MNQSLTEPGSELERRKERGKNDEMVSLVKAETGKEK
jgi:hypothetical protein